jgi:hypothetical protein
MIQVATGPRQGNRTIGTAAVIRGCQTLALLMKLVEISRQEDCFLSGGRNCARLQVPSNR